MTDIYDAEDWDPIDVMHPDDYARLSRVVELADFGVILERAINKTTVASPTQIDAAAVDDGPRAPRPDRSQGSGAYGSPSAPDPARDLAEAMEQAQLIGRRYF